jgi:hypothetical protein
MLIHNDLVQDAIPRIVPFPAETAIFSFLMRLVAARRNLTQIPRRTLRAEFVPISAPEIGSPDITRRSKRKTPGLADGG